MLKMKTVVFKQNERYIGNKLMNVLINNTIYILIVRIEIIVLFKMFF